MSWKRVERVSMMGQRHRGGIASSLMIDINNRRKTWSNGKH